MAATIVSSIQTSVKSKLEDLKQLTVEAKRELEKVKKTGTTADLSVPERLIGEAEDLVKIIEEDGTYGVHNPKLVEALDMRRNQVLLALNWIKQAGGLKEATNMVNQLSTSLETAKADIEASKGAAASATTTAIIALVVGIVATVAMRKK